MLPTWANDTVWRIRPGEKTERGSIVPDWDNADALRITGCSIQPGATTLSQDGRVLAVSDGFTGYFPPGADVKSGDRIRHYDKDYQVMGEPRAWQSPTGRVSSLQAALERWSG